jgi:IS30 family transposase
MAALSPQAPTRPIEPRSWWVLRTRTNFLDRNWAVSSDRHNTCSILEGVLSTRRVAKGPGRRRQSAKREQFMRLLARGWTVAAAHREVGASRSTGNRWKNGYNLYRRGELVGVVAALDPVVERTISARFLSADERVEIADRLRAGESIRAIAAALGRAPSTISREIRRHGRGDGVHRPFEAQRVPAKKRCRPRQLRTHTNRALHDQLATLLKQRWSPQQISRELRAKHPNDPGMWLCAESIYRAIYQPNSTLRGRRSCGRQDAHRCGPA